MKINEKIKKVIAKEFLFLLGSVILSILILSIWSLFININQNKENELHRKVLKLKKYENSPYRLKIYYYLKNELYDDYNFKYKLEKDVIFLSKIKNNEKSNHVYDFIKENGIMKITKEDFYSRILKDNESENHLSETVLFQKKLYDTRNSFFNKSIDNEEILGICLTVFSIFFILRYLIYGTKWSIKQLKVK
ncbi:hypothetical protein [Polaribacter ponticola]|uniref:DUF3592 domain-containing protein n=1 Tax=Polaribacter ponticola TaxID=2978475 RepID=A0ABT5S6V4_9FLAO|nr:hypothetical protein [Polaribacter sp. MSW5]MDD7913823.1 hypothetical protein [Polaribacter sp. MSW5]